MKTESKKRGFGKDCKSSGRKNVKFGIDWSDAEVNMLKKIYPNNTADETAKKLNVRFWKGNKVRTFKAVEQKSYSLGMNKKRELSKYKEGQITPEHKKIWQLRHVGKYTHAQIAKMTGKPIGTIKSMLSYMKQHTMMAEAMLLNSDISESGDVKEMRTKQQLMESIQKLETQLARQKASTSIIVDAVTSAVEKIPPIKVPNIIIKKGMHKPEVAILEFGDLHIGEQVLKGDVANVTEYNFSKFKTRMDELQRGITECVDIQRSKIPIDTLEINMIGDMVTGEEIYLGQRRNIDLDLVDQTFDGAKEISEKLLLPMCSLFNKVRVRAVWGNHGRGWGKPGQTAPRTNFDYIIYMFLKSMFARVKNIEFFISECPVMLYEIPEAPNFVHLLTHGNEVNSWMGIPFYGLQRDLGKYSLMFNKGINYWHLGHHHSAAKIDIPYGEQIINGTFVGGSELSVLKMKTKSRPKQLLFGFNKKYGITWRYDIQLAPTENPKKDDKNIYTAWNQKTYTLDGKK